MKFSQVRLHSWAYVEPTHFLTSEDIENQLAPTYQRLKLPEGRLELQTGIKRRGHWPRGERPSHIAANAAEKLLESFPREKIGLLSHASVCRDFLEPASACVVHEKLQLPSHCMVFDLSNACLGVLSATLLASQMIESGQIEAALIVSGENSGPLLLKTIETLSQDESITRQGIKKFIASLTIGSAGVAWLLTHESLAPHRPKVLGGTTLTDSSAVELCQGGGNLEELSMETDSEALLLAGVKLAHQNWGKFTQEMNLTKKDFARLIPHQVGHIHRKALLETLDLLDMPDFSTFEDFGNTGSAALPLTFMKASEQNVFNNGDKIAFLGIGSGLTSTMLAIEWMA